MMTATPFSRYTARDWNEVRGAFASSILIDTPLSSLAQNLEGVDWPIKGAEETPASYIDLGFDEVKERLALAGQPPRMADHLIEILKETLAFDAPFGEMVSHGEQAAVRENPLLKNLAKLGIPEDFPIALTALEPETLSFCRLENVATLREFAFLAQRMAQSIIVGGDFRSLLNALSNIDEKALARHLPFRPGERGLHIIEALAHAVRAQPLPVRAALRKRLHEPLSPIEKTLAFQVSGNQLTDARIALADRGEILRDWFKDQCRQLERKISAGEEPRHLTVVLNDPVIEGVVADLLKETLVKEAPRIVAAGWFARLMKWRKKQ
ncbi:MAG: hypothetical protein WC661_12570 [Opitutaceae bacterium]|jgi:hypothetical protein